MKNQVYRVLLSVSLVLMTLVSFSQCNPAPPAVAGCAGGNGAVSDGQNINGGQTYWFTGGPTTLPSGVSMNGGTLRVCGNLTLSALNFNSGRIIIESGGILTVNVGGDINFNGNCSICNRGSFTINHGIHMQNANNRIWNDLTSSMLTINGTLEFNSSSSELINRGTANIHDILMQGSALAGAVCLQDYAILNLTSIVNNFTNSFAYNGTGAAPACVSITGSAQLNNNVASSSKIDVCAASTVSYSGGGNWGSATLTANCTSSCNVLLPQDLLSFTASAANGKTRLQWVTADLSPDQAVFYVEASADGLSFHIIGSTPGAVNKSIYTFYDEEQTNATQYYRVRQVVPGGRNGYSVVISVHGGNEPALQLYPNPVITGNTVTLIINAPANGPAKLALIDINGKTVAQKDVSLLAGDNRVDWNALITITGVYIARIGFPGSITLYSRALIITK